MLTVDVCTLAVFVAGWRTRTLEVGLVNAGGHCTLAVTLSVWYHGGLSCAMLALCTGSRIAVLGLIAEWF